MKRLLQTLGCILVFMMAATAYATQGTLELPKDTLRIESEAFSGLGNITEIVLPDGLEYIGSRAFADSGLVKLNIPESVTTIESDAFDGLSSEAVIEVSRDSYAEQFFQENPPIFTVSVSLDSTPWEYIDLTASKGETGWIIKVYGLKDSAYDANGETVFSNLVFSDTYKDGAVESLVIKDSAFEGNTALKGSLVLPDNLTTIESYAFYGCNGLTGVLDLPEGLTQINSMTFAGCTGFTSLSLPETLTSILWSAFDHCTGMTGELNLPANLTVIGPQAFNGCNGFTSDLILPDGLTIVKEYAFANCTGFDGSLSLPGTVTTIGECAFSGCSGFSSLVLGEGLTTLGTHAFKNCTGMRGSLNLPSTLTSISKGAFSNCGFEGRLILPTSLTTIENDAFHSCAGFTGPLYLNNVTSVGSYAFSGCTGFSGRLNLGNVKTLVGSCFENCSGFTGTLSIPYSVESIGWNSFYGCSGFTRLICANAGALDNGSFAGLTGITSAVIDGKAKACYQDMFKDCTSLRSVEMDLSEGNQILESAFENCTSLLSFEIPDPIWAIGQYAFKNCTSLSGIMILPDSLKYIYKGAFENCVSLSGISILGASSINKTAFTGVSPDFVFFSASSSVKNVADALGLTCVSNRLTQDTSASGLPSGTLYKGDAYQISMHLTGSTVFSEIIAEIIDTNGNTVQKASAAVSSMPCSVKTLLGSKLYFEKLPIGTYTFILRGIVAEQDVVVVLGMSTFDVGAAPVRVQISGMDVLRDGVVPSSGAAFEGSISCNYPIDKLTAMLTGENSTDNIQLHVVEPSSSTYDFSALNTDIDLESLTPLNEYRFTLKITAGGTAVNLLNTTFIVSDSGKVYTTAELAAIAEFVGDWENQQLFSKYNDGNEYIKDLGLADGTQLVFQSSLHPTASLEWLLSGGNYEGYMVDCYTQQLLSILSELDETLDLTDTIEEPWYKSAVDDLLKYGKITNTTAKDLTGYDKYFEDFAEAVDDFFSAVSSINHISEWTVDAINDVALILRNFENSLRILDLYKDSAEYNANPIYKRAVDSLVCKFSQQADAAFIEFTKTVLDMSMEELVKLGSNFVYELVTSNDKMHAYSIVTFALKEISSVMGWDDAASGKVELTTQQAIFSNAVYNYVQIFDKIAYGDTSAETISQLELWFRTARSSGMKVYDSLLKIYSADIFNHPYEDEDQRLTGLRGELDLLIYSTPFA